MTAATHCRVFRTDFEDAAERARWSKTPQAGWVNEGNERRTVLGVDVPLAERSPSAMIRRPLDLAAYRGTQLHLTCLVKAENVSRPPESYNGVKFMLHFKFGWG